MERTGAAAARRPAPVGAGRGSTSAPLVVEAQEGARKRESLEVASRIFAASGWRTPLDDVVAECGIFEALRAVELLSSQIATVAVEHAAAVQMTFFEPPVPAAAEAPSAATVRAPLVAAMTPLFEAAARGGLVRSSVDVGVLADQVCQVVLHAGLSHVHDAARRGEVVSAMLDVLAHGLAAGPVEESRLDGSAARRAVDRAVRSWVESAAPAGSDRATAVLDAARAMFGRRGFEVTTMRDIAAEAGVGVGTVCRLHGSKERLLEAVMRSYADNVLSAWGAVLYSDSTPLEKLDARPWQYVNVMDLLRDEYTIQTAWLRQNPPKAGLGWSFDTLLRQLRSLVEAGIETGVLRLQGPVTDLTARCCSRRCAPRRASWTRSGARPRCSTRATSSYGASVPPRNLAWAR